MSDTSLLLGLPYIQPAQAQKHVTHNEAIAQLDAVVQLNVDALDRTAPPAAPAPGARHIVGVGATGAWAGQDNAVAVFDAQSWRFYAPAIGWTAYLRDTATLAAFDGAGWAAVGGEGPPTTLGINTSADADNRLAVASGATLLTHEGADHQLKINKARSDDTASLLFQSGFEGRAEMGLAGSDDFTVKVSADGNTWRSALVFDAAMATVSGEAVQQGPNDTTPGRIMLAEHGMLRSDIVGTVGQVGGVPTGAIIERSTSAAGTVIKWADGTLMMMRTVTIDIGSSGPQDFDYPAPLTTVTGGSAIGADAGQSSGTGGVERRQALADLAVWTNADHWKVRLPDAVAADTLDVTLTVFGLWI